MKTRKEKTKKKTNRRVLKKDKDEEGKNVLYDKTGLKDSQLIAMYQKAALGHYPISPDMRAEMVDDLRYIYTHSESNKIVLGAISALIRMDGLNINIEQLKKSGGPKTVNIALIRQEILKQHAGLIEHERSSAVNSDTGVDGEVLKRREVEDGPSLTNIGQSVGGGIDGTIAEEGLHGFNG
jgi:hypothetical protein